MRRATGGEIGRSLARRVAGAGAAFRDPRRRGGGGRHRDRSFDASASPTRVIAGLLIYRRFDWRRLMPMLVETAALSGAILLIIGAATAMAWALTQSGLLAARWPTAMTGLPGGTAGFLAVSIVAFVILGSVLEGIPAIVLFGPLLFPIAQQVGVHEVHYAMVVILAMGIGLFAPPFGVGYYAACAIGRVNPDEGMKPILGYMAGLAVGLIIVAAIPWISTGFLG